MSHTPGPWRIDSSEAPNEIRVEAGMMGHGVCLITSGEWNKSGNEAEDARLIAAAPEMLDALILAEEALDIREQAEEPLAQPSATLEKIREIILKAAGSLDEE